MVMPDPFVKIDVKNSVTNWLINFEEAINQNNADAASLLFVEDGHWRDLLAFTWQSFFVPARYCSSKTRYAPRRGVAMRVGSLGNLN